MKFLVVALTLNKMEVLRFKCFWRGRQNVNVCTVYIPAVFKDTVRTCTVLIFTD